MTDHLYEAHLVRKMLAKRAPLQITDADGNTVVVSLPTFDWLIGEVERLQRLPLVGLRVPPVRGRPLGGPVTERQPWTDQEPSEAEYQAMAAIIIAQPELNGLIRYSSLRAGIAAYLLDEAEQEDQ